MWLWSLVFLDTGKSLCLAEEGGPCQVVVRQREGKAPPQLPDGIVGPEARRTSFVQRLHRTSWSFKRPTYRPRSYFFSDFFLGNFFL